MSVDSPNLDDLDRFESAVERVEKPWGYELVYTSGSPYSGKVIFVRAGEALSLQFHRVKDETMYVQEGRVELEIGEPGRTPDTEVVAAGRAFRITPGTVHRLRALEDTTILEASTPETDDIVRLEDRYGRGES